MFSSYEKLLEKIDAYLRTLEPLGCPPDCDSCCRVSFAVFPVEAFHLLRACRRLPKKTRERLRGRQTNPPHAEECLFLQDHRCLVYRDRPVICRTHGYPLLASEGDGPEGRQLVPGCDRAAGGSARRIAAEVGGRVRALQLEPLNELLAAVNRVFLTAAGLQGTALSGRLRVWDIPSLAFPGERSHAPL